MVLPVIPVGVTLVRIGVVAAIVYYVRHKHRHVPDGKTSKMTDGILDELPDGNEVETSSSNEHLQANGTSKWKRTIRFGQHGPGVEIDATFLGRIKFKKK